MKQGARSQIFKNIIKVTINNENTLQYKDIFIFLKLLNNIVKNFNIKQMKIVSKKHKTKQ